MAFTTEVPRLELPEPEEITLTRHEDGQITADKFPDVIGVSPYLLGYSHNLSGTITIAVDNGTATYDILGYAPEGLICRKVVP